MNDSVGLYLRPQAGYSLELERQIRTTGYRTISRLLEAAFPGEGLTFETATLSQINKAFELNFRMPVPAGSFLQQFRECIAGSDGTSQTRITVVYPEPLADFPFPGEPYYDYVPEVRVEVPGTDCVPSGDLFSRHYFASRLSWIPAQSWVLRTLQTGGVSGLVVSPIIPTYIPLWEIVADLTVSEAKRELLRRLELSGVTPNAFGLSNFRGLAIQVFPLLIALWQGLMLLHAATARGRIKRTELESFAWVGTYRGIAASLIALTLIVLIPTASVWYIWAQPRYPLSWQFAIVLLCGALGLAVINRIDALYESTRSGKTAS
ncbi:MAG TPA: hypothetical protein VMR74_07290 [Gammaproteobacteria bacterium]|nr:hypothetical protein [Gammaproteobacteria bacterium]